MRRFGRRMRRTVWAVWWRASFSIKFAAVILIAGAVMSIVPFWLAQNATRSQAIDRAADKAGVAANLVQQQRQSLAAFADGVARQLATASRPNNPGALQTALRE